MNAAEIRPQFVDDDQTDWQEGAPLIHGGRVEHRRSAPMTGWWVIRDDRASGPFATIAQAQRWAVRKAWEPVLKRRRAA